MQEIQDTIAQLSNTLKRAVEHQIRQLFTSIKPPEVVAPSLGRDFLIDGRRSLF